LETSFGDLYEKTHSRVLIRGYSHDLAAVIVQITAVVVQIAAVVVQIAAVVKLATVNANARRATLLCDFDAPGFAVRLDYRAM
jgi:hypothetical protein